MNDFSDDRGHAFELLMSMWKPKVRRSIKLIVPEVSYSGLDGKLNNDHWDYKVPYAFRSSLDMSYDERVKEKKSYWV